jgi:hypothetical protein
MNKKGGKRTDGVCKNWTLQFIYIHITEASSGRPSAVLDIGVVTACLWRTEKAIRVI